MTAKILKISERASAKTEDLPQIDGWTPKQRDVVRRAAKTGVPHERIAQALGVTMTTLRKHFPDELSDPDTRGS